MAIGLLDLSGDLLRHRSAAYEGFYLLRDLLKPSAIVIVERGEELLDGGAKTGLLKEVAIGLGSNNKPRGHRDLGLGHLPEVGSLSSRQVYVLSANLGKP